MNNSTKYALVTGASSGIGWHLSKELAQRGYAIIAVSNQAEKLKGLQQELEQNFNVSVITLNIDLSKTSSAQEVFDFCEAQQLEVEVLVNNAGLLVMGDAVDVTYKKAATILTVHMNTPALLCNVFGKQMATRKKGYILNTSSISAIMPYPTISYYGPSKTFVRYFTKALRTELKPHNVKVTCLIPGATATELLSDFESKKKLALRLGVMKHPEFVAKAGVKALMKGRSERIPGFINKLTVLFLPLVPQGLIGLIYRKWVKK